MLKAATRIIAISNHTKRDIISMYGMPDDRISVVHLGADTGNEKKPVKSVDGKKYIFYVGKRDGYKNFTFMVRALAPVFEKDQSLSLVCTGRSFNEVESRLLDECGMTGRASANLYGDDELRWLYTNACVFIYPSRYEGFGLPILDAFSLGCPVLLANATSFPEVGGDAALYFDPKDEEDLRRQLERVIGEDDEARNLRADLIARGKERVKMFSWKKCAEETAGVYRKCVSEFER